MLTAIVVLTLGFDLVPGCAGERDGPVRLSSRLHEARVTATVGGRTLELTQAGPALHAAGLPGWNWVGPRPMSGPLPKKGNWSFPESTKPGESEEVCLWVHPVNNGQLQLDFHETPLGGRIEGFFHAPRSAAKSMHVVADLLLDGQRLKRLTPKLKPGGVWEFEAELPGADTGVLSVVIRQKKRGKNHLCFDGVVHAP